ncbi:MAG TPA: hypothetical protein VIH99_07000 [Bdellovibrionota bacterium]|jgi:hypothetical protein
MKTNKLPLMTLASLVIAISLNACGKTNRASSDTTASSAPISAAPSVPPTPGPIVTVPPTTPPTPATGAPLSFEFDLRGDQTAITPAIPTDNVLKVRFVPGTNQGNSYHSASELAVTITINNTDFTPKYTSSNYTYGVVGESSNVLDLSAYIPPGSVQIMIKNPKSDYYCTYAPNPFYYYDPNTGAQVPTNPLYNSYPGCRRSVFVNQQNPSLSHRWSGKLLVQTSSTSPL